MLRQFAPAVAVDSPARASGTARRVRPVTSWPVPGPVGERAVDVDLDGVGGGGPR